MPASISEDGSFIACAGPHGATLYQIEPFGLMKTSWPSKPCVRAHAFLRTGLSLTAVVFGSSPRTVAVHASNLPLPFCELTMTLLVRQVFMNRNRLLVLTSDGSLSIYEVPRLSLLCTLRLGTHAEGACAFNEDLWLVVPCSKLDSKSDLPGASEASPGSVIVYDAMNLALIVCFEAHTLPIQAIALSDNSIATALTTGTIVRVHKVDAQAKTAILSSTWRRGRLPSIIMRLQFSEDSSVLACASRHTVHLFRMGDTNPQAGRWRALPKMPHYASGLVNLQQRSFTSIRVNEQMDETVQLVIGEGKVYILLLQWLHKYMTENNVDYKRVESHLVE